MQCGTRFLSGGHHEVNCFVGHYLSGWIRSSGISKSSEITGTLRCTEAESRIGTAMAWQRELGRNCHFMSAGDHLSNMRTFLELDGCKR